MNDNHREVIKAILERFISDELYITHFGVSDNREADFSLEMTDRVRWILDTVAISFGMEYEAMMQEFLQKGLNKKVAQSGLLKK